MILKKIGKKLGMVGASLVLMTAQMTPFFVFGGQVSAEQLNTVSDHCTTGDMLGIKVDTGAIGVHVVDPVTVTIANNSSTDKTEVTNVVGDSVTITKVVVKGGSVDGGHGNGNAVYTPVFDYPLAAPNNSGGNQADISHVIVCYDQDDVEPELVTLRLKKTVINDDGGTLNADQFGISIVGFSTPVFGNPMSTNGDTKVYQTSSAFPELDRDIIISEIDTPNYDEGTWECSNGVNGIGLSVTITLVAGDDVTCEITNDDIPVELPDTTVTVTKFVNNNYGGDTPANEFPIRLNGSLLTPGDVVTPTSAGGYSTYVTEFVEPGVEFVITEDSTEGYKLKNITCKVGNTNLTKPFVPKAGEEVKCNVVNEDLPNPTVTVTKFVNYENGGNKPANEFPVRLNGDLLTPGDLVTPPNGNTYSTFETVSVNPGVEFTVSEDATNGYRLRNITCKSGDVNVKNPYTPTYGETVTCNVVNVDLPGPQIVASKLVCNNEALLPNWGAGGPSITSLTAIEYADKYDGCELEEGWIFEYAFNNQKNPGDNIEEGGAGWTPFGPTNSDGEASVEIEEPEEVSRVWIREQLKTGYLGFTFNENNKTNVDSISAELYCNNDVLNYDNFDYISNPEYGNTYYCVAWNVQLAQIRAIKYNDRNGNGTRESETEERLNKWEMTVYDEKGNEVASGYTGEDNDGRVVFADLLPGTYKVCETLQEGWSNTEPGTEDACKEVVLTPGQDAVARFGNMLKKSNITVTKFNDQNQNGYFDDYEVALPDWTITLTPEYMCDVYETDTLSLVSAFVEEIDCPVALSMEQVTDENGVATFSGLNAGVYEFDEIEQDNWTKTNRYCSFERRSVAEGIVKVSPGETVNCYIGNYQAPSIDVVKTGPSSAPAGTEVEYTFTVTNTGGSSLSDITVVDSITGNATYVSGDNGDNVLDVTETWIYTAKYTIPVNQLADVVNTVQACGDEVVNYGDDEYEQEEPELTQVCDSDDHTLSVPQVLGTTTPTVTTTTPPAVLATTGADASYAMTTGAILIAAALLTGAIRKPSNSFSKIK